MCNTNKCISRSNFNLPVNGAHPSMAGIALPTLSVPHSDSENFIVFVVAENLLLHQVTVDPNPG